jgi:hypothetical protein
MTQLVRNGDAPVRPLTVFGIAITGVFASAMRVSDRRAQDQAPPALREDTRPIASPGHALSPPTIVSHLSEKQA